MRHISLFVVWPLLRTSVLLPILVLRAAKVHLRRTIKEVQAGTASSLHTQNLDFRLCRGQFEPASLKHKRRNLTFIHIPRCAGTSIEDCTVHEEVGWGSVNEELKGRYKTPQGGTCFKQHIPPTLLGNYYEGKDTFCVVRNPYERMISEFHFPWNPDFASMARAGLCNAASLNKFAIKVLTGAKTNPYGHDCHLLPQAAFVYDWDDKTHAVQRNAKQWCKRLIPHENLQKDFNALMEDNGYKYRLTGVVSPHNVAGPYWNCTHVTPNDFTAEARKLINEVWRADFEFLNFTMLPVEKQH